MSDAQQSIRRHIVAVSTAAVFMASSFVVMGATINMSGALISSGSLVVQSDIKKVQHPSGGVVKTLLVSEGAHVAAGALLVQLDEVVARANLSAITKSLWELEARQARLQAERDGATNIVFPAELTEETDAAAVAIMAGERRFFELRHEASEGQKRQLNEQIAQLRDEIGGLNEQLASKTQESGYLSKEQNGVEELWQQKLVSLTRLTALQRDSARLLGEQGQLKATVAQTKGKISETELKILQIDQDFRSSVAKELADVRASYAETTEKRVTARDQTERLELRAPEAGIVHDLKIHTEGGVIGAGETVMTIVPDSDRLVVDTHVEPRDVSQILVGQPATLRFTNFNQRTTPEINGEVTRVGADVSREDQSSAPYYVVRIAINADEAKRLGDVKLLPGMPVEVYIRTGERTMLSYLMKPLADQARRAFRER